MKTLSEKSIQRLEKLGIIGGRYIVIPDNPSLPVMVLNENEEEIGEISLSQAFKL